MRVVVFVHGYGDFTYGRLDFAKLNRHLRDIYDEAHYIKLPFAGVISMKRNLEAFMFQLAEIQQKTGVEKLDLVGHSLGGLVIVAFAKLYPRIASWSIDHAIILGAPLRGTKTTELSKLAPVLRWFTDTVHELSHRSDFVLELRNKPLPKGPEFHIIAALHDTFLIRPWDSALWLRGAEKHMVAPWESKVKIDDEEIDIIKCDAGHLSIVRKKPVIDKIVEILSPPKLKAV